MRTDSMADTRRAGLGRLRLPGAVISVLLLAGCASISPDGGFGPVQQTASERLGKEVRWARTAGDQDRIDARVTELLAKPLTVDDAVQVAPVSYTHLTLPTKA